MEATSPAALLAAQKKTKRKQSVVPSVTAGNRLRTMRKRFGLTLDDVREATGVNVWHLENKPGLPNVDSAIRLAKFYGQTVEQIWG